MKRKIIVFCMVGAFFLQADIVTAANYNAYKIYLKGVLAAKAGKFDIAMKDYERVISLDPEALAVYKDLVYLYWQAGSNQKALIMAEKINELDGKNPNTTVFLATFYLVANDPDSARKYWEKTLQLDPENETATVYLAAYYYSDNKLQESAEYWNKFLKQQPDSAAGYFQLAMVQEKLGMNEDALVSYDKVIELKPEAREAYIAKARIYETMEKYNLAITEYEEYVSAFPDNLYVLMYLGKCYYEAGEMPKARDAFLKAKKGLPNEPTAIYGLGVIYEKMEQFDKAAAEFEILAQKEPSAAVYARLGFYYSLIKDYAKAEKRMIQAQEKDPLNFEIWYLLGLNYVDWGKYDKALAQFNKVIDYNPEFVEAYFYQGISYDKRGDFKSAESAFLKTLELDPDHSRALNYLGYTYADKNMKLDQAEQFLNKAVSLEPKNGAYLDSLGWLYFRQKKYELAEKFIRAAASLAIDPLIYDHLGDTYVELDRLTDAWMAYSLSYDTAKNKTVKKKFNLVQSKLTEEELYALTLKRSSNNFKKIGSFKTGYKMKASKGFLSTSAYFPLNYVKGEGINVEIPAAYIVGGATAYIKDGEVTFNPKAIGESISEEFSSVLSFSAEVFTYGFYPGFSAADTIRKGNEIIYKKEDIELVIDIRTGLIKKIVKDRDLVINIISYTNFLSSQIPSKISINSSKMKVKAVFEANKFTAVKKNKQNKEERKPIDDIKEKTDENKVESSGKN